MLTLGDVVRVAGGVASGVMIVIIGALAVNHFFAEPDFTLSIGETNKVASVTGVSPEDNTITMHNVNPYDNYKSSVALIALERGESRLPPGVIIEFKPSHKINLEGNESMKSDILINLENNAERGDHLIDIFGLSEDGKERKCSFYLYIS